jgi:hypothetical protein
MNSLLDKLKLVMQALEKANNPFLIFALFLREEPLEQWDVVVSATWLNSSEIDSYKKVSSEIQTSLTSEELMQLARVVILNPNDTLVVSLQNEFSVKNGKPKDVSSEFFIEKFPFKIKRAFLLHCQKIEDFPKKS